MLILVSLLLLWNFSLCFSCTINDSFVSDPAFASLMCIAEDVEFQRNARNAIECANLCAAVRYCHSFIFCRGDKTCFGLCTPVPSGDSLAPLSGAVFYTSAAGAAVSGPPTVLQTYLDVAPHGCEDANSLVMSSADDQYSASGFWNGGYEPHMSRMSNVDTCWSAQSATLHEYIEVDFLTEKVITLVRTKGCPVPFEWVTSYNILVSSDCQNYIILSENGAPKVFAGNAERDNMVDNTLDQPVSGRCIRLRPVAWHKWISLRIGIMGCNISP